MTKEEEKIVESLYRNISEYSKGESLYDITLYLYTPEYDEIIKKYDKIFREEFYDKNNSL